MSIQKGSVSVADVPISARGGTTVLPLARSPIPAAAPTTVVDGWEVSDRRSNAAVRLADLSPLAKVHVRASEGGSFGDAIGVAFMQTARDEHGVLVTGSGPGEWTLIGSVGTAGDIAARVAAIDVDERVTVVDVTHGRALLRLTGEVSPEVLAYLCAIDLASTRDGTCLRSSVARVVTDIIRDDQDGQTSFLLHCERSSAAYLAGQLTEVGQLHGLEIDGFLATVGPRPDGPRTAG